MKKHLMFIGILVILFSSVGYAVENCCGLYSPGNDFKCGPHNNNSTNYGNCTWHARYKRPEVDGICTRNASQWFSQAKNGGLCVGPTVVVGSIAVFDNWMTIDGVRTNVGHVAYVESVNASGSFNVSEMGWNTWNGVHYGTWTKTSLGGLLGFIYPVGRYSDGIDGFHTNGTSQAFIDAFNRHYPKIGWPTNRGGGVYVHSWVSTRYPSYSVWIQDFQGDTNAAHFETDGQSAIMLSDYIQPAKAFLIKEGMWGYYKTNNGQYELGAPFTEEVINLRYATNKQPYRAGDAVKAGDAITVQKFYRVYGNQRRTLVYNNTRGGNVIPFPVGEFSIGGDGTCPNNEQVYIKVDGNPANDIPWPLLGKLTPTGKWFTKPDIYDFVIHRANSWPGVSAVITEGNEQNIGGLVVMPQNLTATAETASSIRLAFTLPTGLVGYNIRVYQDGQKTIDTPAVENMLITGLSPSVNYCFRVSAVNNVSGAESAKSAEACATTQASSSSQTPRYTGENIRYINTAANEFYDISDPNRPILLGNMADYAKQLAEQNFAGYKAGFDNPASADLEKDRFIQRESGRIYQVLLSQTEFLPSLPTPSPSFIFGSSAVCLGVNANGEPTIETSLFYSSNNYVYSWIELNRVYGAHNLKWQWLDPGGSLAAEGGINTPVLFNQSVRKGYRLDVASQTNYGAWQVKTYVDNSLVAANAFALAVVLAAPLNLTVTPQKGPKVVLNWQASAKAASYRIYRDEAFLAETTSTTYTDTVVQSAVTYGYKVLTANAGYQSPFSETKTVIFVQPPTNLRIINVP